MSELPQSSNLPAKICTRHCWLSAIWRLEDKQNLSVVRWRVATSPDGLIFAEQLRQFVKINNSSTKRECHLQNVICSGCFFF